MCDVLWKYCPGQLTRSAVRRYLSSLQTYVIAQTESQSNCSMSPGESVKCQYLNTSSHSSCWNYKRGWGPQTCHSHSAGLFPSNQCTGLESTVSTPQQVGLMVVCSREKTTPHHTTDQTNLFLPKYWWSVLADGCLVF